MRTKHAQMNLSTKSTVHTTILRMPICTACARVCMRYDSRTQHNKWQRCHFAFVPTMAGLSALPVFLAMRPRSSFFRSCRFSPFLFICFLLPAAALPALSLSAFYASRIFSPITHVLRLFASVMPFSAREYVIQFKLHTHISEHRTLLASATLLLCVAVSASPS